MSRNTPQRVWQTQPLQIRRGQAFLPLTLTFLGLGGLVTSLNYIILGISLPLATLLGTVLALIPLAALGWYFSWLDSGEPETRRMFFLAFFWGSIAATGFALVANTLSVSFFGTFVGVALVAPVVEEVSKGALIFFLFWWRRAHFDGPLDGIIYAGFIGMGFAFVENITYFTAAYSGLSLFDDATMEGGPAALIATFALRGGVTLFAHPLFTAATGLGLGLASMSKSPFARWALAISGLVGACVLHGLWNGSLTAAPPELLGAIYLFFFIPVFIAYIVYSLRARSDMSKNLGHALHELSLVGLVHPADVAWLSSRRTRRAVLEVAQATSRPAGKAMKAYQTNALHFAKLHHRVGAGVPPESYREIGQHYSLELQALRPHLQPRPPELAQVW